MLSHRRVTDAIDDLEEDEYALFLAMVAVAVLSAGYATGSILAGESLGSQVWVLPVVGGTVAVLAALVGDDEE